MIEIINTTPHDVFDVETQTKFPKSDIQVRVGEKISMADKLDKFQLYTREFDEVVGLPDEKEGVYYIVSFIVVQALPHRKDLLTPGILERDSAGNITGSQGFFKNELSK
jgi:hypothetical protein